METVVDSIVSKVTEPVVDSIWRQIGYVWNYQDNIKSLKDQLAKLKGQRLVLQHRVDEVTRNGEEIEDLVKNWLTSVDEAIKAAEKILEDNQTANQSCFMGCRPNLNTRYQLSRLANKETTVLFEVCGEGKFDKISYHTPLQGIGLIKDYKAFESRLLLVKQIMEALKDPDVHLIGVYGMAGVGKTTLAKKIAEQAKEEGIFKVAVMAVVTQNVELKIIQDKIAEWLGLKFDVESLEGKAARLCERLKKEEKILVILDDIWAKIGLQEIGIPFGKDHKGCKILMTSRSQNVLSNEMDTDKDFRLEVLSDEEAWNLFEMTVGNAVKDPNLQSVAIEVAKRCAGLPLLLVAVARALKKRDIYAWKDALEQLRRFDNDELDKQVTSALKLSYDSLENEEIKALFLLFGQLGTQRSHMADLLQYTVGLGLFKRSRTLEEARNRLHKYASDLLASCLLLEVRNDGFVHIHDLVCKFAVSLASRDHQALTLTYDAELKEWPAKDVLEHCTAIILPYRNIPELPRVLECPKLKLFILCDKDCLLKIPDNFFRGMKELKVLDIGRMDFSPRLPSSFQFLSNLETLILYHCVLEDIAIIGELKKLQVLRFQNSNIVRLPIEVKELTRLRLLDLSGCERLQVIPPDVLSRLTQLEDLYMGNSFVQWEGEGHDCPRNNANLAELKLLSNLITLEIHIVDVNILPKDLFSEKLERFRIFIGKEWKWSGSYNTSKTLKLKLNSSIHLDKFKVLLLITENLHLDDLKGVNNVLNELDEQGFPRLKQLYIQNCLEIQYIIDWMSMSHFNFIAFPRLESLFLGNLNNLETISCGPPTVGSFGNLTKLKVGNCNRLKNLFSFSMFRELARLEEVDVSSCKIMEEIVAKETRDDSDSGKAIKLTQLRTLTLEYLPRLTSFCSQVNVPSTSQRTQKLATVNKGSKEMVLEESETFLLLCSKKIEFPNLVDLKLSSINVEKIWSNQILGELSPCIKNLTTLMVDGCGNLSYLFTSSMVGSLVQLKEVGISDCKSMEEVIVTKGEGEMMSKTLFPKLESLKLKVLPNLTRFCSGYSIDCPSLKVLWIENCPHLQAFITSSVSADVGTSISGGQSIATLFDKKVLFPNLEELHIRYMHKLKMIWYDELQVDSFRRLKVLKVQYGEQLLKIFPSKLLRRFLNLETLVVNYCNLVEEVFDLQVLMKKQETNILATTQLRYLEMDELPNLKHVWSGDPHGILSFDNLRKVYAWDCPNLKILFPFSVARSLPQLEVLSIDDCGGLEEVVDEERVEVEATPKFVFPRLKYLILWRLEKLKCFYQEKHTLECKLLECLNVYRCDNLEMFTSEPAGNLQTTHMESQLKIPLLLFSFIEVIPKLKTLGLDNKYTTMIRHGQFPSERLEHLQLHSFHDASADFPFDLLHKFQNIKRLSLKDYDFKVLFPHGIVGEAAGVLAQLRYLRLEALHHMSHIWSEDCQPGDVFENLETLEICDCPSLSTLAPSFASFQNLTTLNVYKCHGLVNLVASSTAKSMVNLTTLIVRHNNMVKEIIANEEDETLIIFSELETLKLHCLKNLTSFCSVASCTIKFPSLKEVFVTQCPSMKNFSQGVISAPKLERVYLTGDRDKWRWIGDLNTTIKQLYEDWVGFIGLQHLKLSEFPQVKQVWHDQLPVNLFYNLNTLVVDDCEFTSSSVPSNLLPFLYNLEQLEVRNCEAVDQVFGLEWPNANGFVGHLSKLTRLTVVGCGNLKYILSPSMVKSFVNLKRLEIADCKKMEQVIVREGFEGQTMISEILFCALEFLKLVELPKLTRFCTSNLIECPAMKELWIQNCPVLMTFVSNSATTDMAASSELEILNSTLFDDKVVFPNLEELQIGNLPNLKHVWNKDPQQPLSFANLSSVYVWKCPILKSLFPASIAKNLLQLEKIDLDGCGLEELVTMEEEVETNPKFVFPQLKSLDLWRLEELKCFYPGTHTLKCPVLERLVVCHCEKLKVFGMKDEKNLEETQMEKPLFSFREVIPKLKTLGLDNKYTTMIRHGQFPSDRLEYLQLHSFHDASADFPFYLFHKFLNIKRLALRYCNFKVLFPHGIVGEAAGALAQLQYLKLEYLPHTSHIWSEDCQPGDVFQNLQTLEIWNCHSLSTLAPSSASFQNLTTLDVYKCHGLVNLVASSTAKSMVNLTTLIVRHNNMVKEIVADEGDETLIIFSKLETLKLHCLKNLTSFCSVASCTIKFPSLKEVFVTQCPSMKNFSQGVISAPKLERVYLTGDRDKWRWIGDLNTTIKQLYEDLVGFIGLQDLKLSEFPQVKQVWHDQLPVNLFYNLNTLVVDDCAFTSSSVPSNLLPFLYNLEQLEVRNCEAVEQVFGLEWPNANGFVGHLSKLTRLTVVGCGNLKYILSPSMVKSFVNLKRLEIADCKKMEQVIVREGFEGQTMISEILFCALEFLKLENLPKLTQFCTTNLIECPALKELEIQNCPQLMTFVSNSKSASAINAGELEIFNSALFDEKVLFPNLEILGIVNLHKLKMLWDDELRGDSFCGLKELRVEHGKELLKFFPSRQLRRFLNIESLVINDCDLVEEVFDLQLLVKIQETDVVATHQLRYLDIDNLPKLKHVWNGDPHGILSFHNLEKIYAWNCPSLKNLFRLSVARSLPQLELLNIDGCDGLEEVVPKEERIEATPKFVFPQLKYLYLWRSQELKCFFPEKHSLECTQLETLNVYCCDKLEIFTSEAWDLQRTSMEKQLDQSQLKTQVPKPFFSFGEDLKVSSSFDNEKIRNSQQLEMYSSIQNLTSLIVDRCANLKYLLSSSMIKSVVNLKRMQIINCEKMEQVIVRWEGLEGQTMNSEILFRALEFLELDDLPKLTRFCTSNLIECPALKELSIENCPVLMTFVSNSANADMAESSELEILNFTLFDEKVAFPNLEQIQISDTDTLTKIWHNQLHSDSFYKLTTLDIRNLPNLKHVWNKDPQQVLSFTNLSSVHVRKCPSLKSLFPASIAKNLLQLEKIDLDGCGLEELVTMEEEVETNLKFVFPQLESLDLWRLEELKCFYPGTHTLECPVLERLVVCHCDKLDVFVLKPDEKNLQETHMEKPLFSLREIVPNLKDLSLTSKDAKMISQGQFPEDLFHKLEVIQINCFHDESAVFPFDLLQRFHSMEKLVVRCSKFKELFPYDEFVGKVNYVKTTEQIRHLDLANLPDLENIWNQDYKLDQALKSLETLEVWLCNSLITLAPSSASFQNLTTMDVESCNGLVSLVTSSTAKSLVQLTNMCIRECEKLTEIVTKEGDDDGSTEEIIFNKLQSLQLLSLPKLKNFCLTKNSFQFPSLTQVIVSQCPEMQVFSKGVLITPMLQTLQMTEQDKKGRWDGNLNATIKQLFTEMVCFG